MRALLIVTRPPQPMGKGDAKVAHYAAAALGQSGHEVHVLHGSGSWSAGRAALAALRGPFDRRPAQLTLTRSSRLHSDVLEACRRGAFDVLIAVHPRATVHVPPQLRERTLALIMDLFSIGYDSYGGHVSPVLAPLFATEARRMARYESHLLRSFGRVAVFSPPEAERLRRMAPDGRRIVRLPLPVDAQHFGVPGHRRPAAPVFAFIGRLNYLPNRVAVQRLASVIWPRLRQEIPGARLLIAGGDPAPELHRVAARAGAELVPNPPDIRPLLSSATAVMAPVGIGSGVQNKVLEAMAAGTPVICSPFANLGIGATDGEHLLLAESTAGFVESARRVVDHPDEALAMAGRAQRWVSEHHSLRRFGSALTGACEELVGERHGPEREALASTA